MTKLTPEEMARTTAMLSHIGGILEYLPLEQYLTQLREQRAAVPLPWQGGTPAQEATGRRVRALIAAATKASEIVDEIHTASAFWRQARALELEDPPPGAADPEAAGGVILAFPPGAGHDRCKCPMGECSHKVGLDGPA